MNPPTLPEPSMPSDSLYGGAPKKAGKKQPKIKGPILGISSSAGKPPQATSDKMSRIMEFLQK
jgi:hypothetical protein